MGSRWIRVGLVTLALSVSTTGCTFLDGLGLGDAVDGDVPPRLELPDFASDDTADIDGDDAPGEVVVGDDCGLSAQEAEEIALTNDARALVGAAPLECDARGVRAARNHSNDMCARGYFEHDSPEGLNVGDRLDAVGADYAFAGENIGWGYLSAEAVHEGWMGSSGHRENLLNPGFVAIGVAVDECGGDPLWTQVLVGR